MSGVGGWAGILPFAAYMIVFLGIPLYVVLHGSVTTDSNQFTWANFKLTWTSSSYREGFKNSLILSIWTSAVGAFFGTWLAAAVATAKRDGLLHRIVQSSSGVLAYFAGVPLAFAFIAALGIQGVVTVLLKHFGIDLYAHGFTISSMTGVGLCYVYFQIPLMVILMTPALQGLRAEWEEAALNLGASKLGYLRHVAVPVLLPSFVGSTLILFGNAFSAYATALALVGSTLNITPAQIDESLNGNVLVNADRVGLTLGTEMVIVSLVVMVGYWLVQRRARRWLR